MEDYDHIVKFRPLEGLEEVDFMSDFRAMAAKCSSGLMSLVELAAFVRTQYRK